MNWRIRLDNCTDCCLDLFDVWYRFCVHSISFYTFVNNGCMISLYIARLCAFACGKLLLSLYYASQRRHSKVNVGFIDAGLLRSPHLRGLCFYPEPFPVGQIPIRSEDSNCTPGVMETAPPWPIPPWPTRTCPRSRPICSVSSQHHRRCGNNF